MTEIQVERSHYDWLPYNRKARWISYWHQITEVLATGGRTCLEIGTGSGFVRDALVKQGMTVTTVDIDPGLGVDRVGDVRRLPAEAREVDVVLCSQVLEHIPWQDVPAALAEIHRVCRSHAVISVPQAGLALGLSLGARVGDWLVERGWSLGIPDPRPFRFNGQHYWEVGARGCSRPTVRNVFEAGFAVEREYVVPEFTYHRFYVLRKC